MKTAALLLLLFCLAEADDIRWEFQSFKSQLEGQLAALTLEVTKLKSDLTLEVTQRKAGLTLEVTQLMTGLTLEVTQLKSDVKRLKYQCPSGWTKFGDSCYYMSTAQSTWQKSREDCQNKGADLLVINSGEELDFVDRLIGGGKPVWFGLTDRETEGEWKWVDGTPLTTPTYWKPGEPNDYGEGQDCAAFINGGWNDIRCGSTGYWMCEIVF